MLSEFDAWKAEVAANGYVVVQDDFDNEFRIPLIRYETLVEEITNPNSDWVSFTTIYGLETHIRRNTITTIGYISAEYAQRHWADYKEKAMSEG